MARIYFCSFVSDDFSLYEVATAGGDAGTQDIYALAWEAP
jgi:hypothetical protein